MGKHILRWVILLAIGFSIGSVIGYIQSKREIANGEIAVSPDDNVVKSKALAASSGISGEFSLIDHNGQAVTHDTYAGSYKLIFFGFTYCPAVCPAELQKITLIMGDLAEEAEKVTPLFITIDPQRDNIDVMKDYVVQFHPDLIGLTGSQEQVDAVKKSFKVYATKVENEMMDEYMMDHSSFMYLMSPDNKIVGLYPAKDEAIDIAESVKALILQ